MKPVQFSEYNCFQVAQKANLVVNYSCGFRFQILDGPERSIRTFEVNILFPSLNYFSILGGIVSSKPTLSLRGRRRNFSCIRQRATTATGRVATVLIGILSISAMGISQVIPSASTKTGKVVLDQAGATPITSLEKYLVDGNSLKDVNSKNVVVYPYDKDGILFKKPVVIPREWLEIRPKFADVGPSIAVPMAAPGSAVNGESIATLLATQTRVIQALYTQIEELSARIKAIENKVGSK